MHLSRLVLMGLVLAGLAGVGMIIFGAQQFRPQPGLEQHGPFTTLLHSARHADAATDLLASAVKELTLDSVPAARPSVSDDATIFLLEDRDTFLIAVRKEMQKLEEQLTVLNGRIEDTDSVNGLALAESRGAVNSQISRLRQKLSLADKVDDAGWKAFAKELDGLLDGIRKTMTTGELNKSLASRG